MKIGQLNIAFGFSRKFAGLTSFWFSFPYTQRRMYYHYSIHLFPWPSYWEFGISHDWYDGPIISIGFGPALLICLS